MVKFKVHDFLLFLFNRFAAGEAFPARAAKLVFSNADIIIDRQSPQPMFI
jgi:hypothetical protein